MEITGIILMIILPLIGVIADIKVANGFVLHFIDDINSFSLTLLQIQASVGTLTIALVALISGNISDSYMGISVSDYYLNLRPAVLKQKVIIILSLILLMVGVITHIWQAYNSVIALFIATILLVVVSILEIYSIFKGKKSLQAEIEAYISYIMGSNKKYQKKSSLCEDFVKDWTENIENQDTKTYERYVEILGNHIFTLLNAKSNKSIEDVENLCFSVSETFLKSDKTEIKKRGIQFLNRIYEKMWSYILDNGNSLNEISTEYTLFGNLQLEFQGAINDMPLEIIEKTIDWNYMSDSIERIAFWISNKSTQQNLSELDSVNYVSRFWGVYLRKQQQKGNVINQYHWGYILENLYLSSAFNVPEKYADDFLYHKVQMYFNYFYGLITNGYGYIIKEHLYFRGMASLHTLHNRYEAIFYLAIQCYLYYLAECENENCISSEIRTDAQFVIQDKQIKYSNEYIIQLLTYKEEFIDWSLEENIYKLLKPFELRSKYSNFKTLIMQNTVREFFVFILLHIENKSYMPQLVENTIDTGKLEEFYLYFLGAREEEIKCKFSKLSMLYDTRISQEAADAQANRLYEKLEAIIKTKYKIKSIARADAQQKIYETSGEQIQIIQDIKSKVRQHLQEKFTPIIAENCSESGIFKLHLLSSREFTNTLSSAKVNRYYWDIDGALVQGLTDILRKRGLVTKVNKSLDFKNDIEYIDYLEHSELDILLGSEYAIKNSDYNTTGYFKEYSKKCKCIYTGFAKHGLALKSDDIRICIHDVNVSIHSLTFGEIALNFDEEKQCYIYEISHGMPVEFTKEELKSFIRNERKILDISVKISIISKTEKVGIVISRV